MNGSTSSGRTAGWRRRGAAVLLAAGCALPGGGAHAAAVPWRAGDFDYVADHKDLKEVLRDFAASQGITTWISPEVSGTVSGRFHEPPQRFIDTLAGGFGIAWYYDGSALRVWGANEVKSATVNVSAASVADVRGALDRLGIVERRFPVRYDDAARAVFVSGPPGYVDLVADVARRVDDSARRRDATEIRVFPLRYASAADRSTRIDGQNVRIAGVASLLRGMYGEHGASGGDAQTLPSNDFYRLDSLGGAPSGARDGASPGGGAVGLPSGSYAGSAARATMQNPPLPPDMRGASTARDAAAGATDTRRDGSDPDAPIIQADPRTNAIVIRDRPNRMADYESVIRKLDARPKLLEIDATIIEIQDGALQQLGVDWRLHTGHVDFETGDGTRQQAGFDTSLNPQGFGAAAAGAAGAAALTPLGGTLTAVLGDAGRYLLARVSALEQNNLAKITSSPKVATLDNVEAVMDHRQKFFVRVSGYQSADLYNLSAGVSLRVLPTVVPDAPDGQIRLDVHIEDGQITSQTVDQIPVITSSEIITQAFVRDGQSLLVAGYESDTDSQSVAGVPLLSKIPLIGNLFKYRQNQGTKFQRLFLVTPHILSP
ncbi:EscC/YscC/HrcC family type III secretion system outer membrane ring protein [Burkholderia pyrrocinia]|uniref:Type 3 secretion system secretin n=1 Tax=Burkholderia pyrrocinia TaxID=60550 RepID=A0A2Z5NAQ8_BURPY|nr:type III secretion system outer membrane ring subunit SctC [Burkholderia pyrrocinia]AXF26126.1 EscC/YscC/HrcC family type III secretion system outer membrane ring protein [Burkholderia pyrrocinia]